jgi:hypothetical protein
MPSGAAGVSSPPGRRRLAAGTDAVAEKVGRGSSDARGAGTAGVDGGRVGAAGEPAAAGGYASGGGGAP